ncbi:hypothetical protein HX109_06980 [Galbibacter sp. BG1]|uniref:hypothetical protein n=1 Tax=Galbibacter sp. BG1 TaxID=1170699 RepID=UPI0015BED76D|nr:hypothetical protein [Galbibacter sp. BG1]QLE01323.1 hypothetical protein HX109_06980 [Galbibacter sp. BG1]
MNWCLIIPLIVGVVCAVLGYLLGKLSAGDHSSEIEAWQKKYDKLDSDLADCRAKLARKDTVTTHLIPFDAAMAKSAFGKKIKQDDLKIVEGIGPKIELLFHAKGIKTWKELSDCSVEKCYEVLKSGGKAFDIHRPETWPEQAKLAYEGKWIKLKAWQDELKGGK